MINVQTLVDNAISVNLEEYKKQAEREYQEYLAKQQEKKMRQINKFYARYPKGQLNFIPVRIMNIFEDRLMKELGYEMSLDNFLLSRLALGDGELKYLKSLKGQCFGDLKLLREGYRGGNEVIKDYVGGVLDERIYSHRLF